ncbi:MAG: radical SAM protein [Candidatus Hodarchaeota archaeon]
MKLRVSRYCVSSQVSPKEYMLIQTLSGAVDIVDNGIIDALDKIKQQKTPSLDSETQDYLFKRGYLTELNPKQETKKATHFFDRLQNHSKQGSQYTFVITYDCNMRCTYCYEQHVLLWDSKKRNCALSISQVDQAFKLIDEYDKDVPDHSRQPLRLFGGEPLLKKNRKIVEYILTQAIERNYKFGVITNGLQLDSFLSTLKLDNLELIFITLDGPPEIHDRLRPTAGGGGTFERIAKNIDLTLKEGLPITINYNFEKQNLPYIDKFQEIMVERGWRDNPHLHSVFSSIFNLEAESEFEQSTISASEIIKNSKNKLEFLKEGLSGLHPFAEAILNSKNWVPRIHHCGSNRQISFDPLGDLYACRLLIGKPKAKIGEYWPEFKPNELYTLWRKRSIATIPECRKCHLATLCGGGCPYRAVLNSENVLSPHCDSIRPFLTHFVPNLYKVLRTSENNDK